MPDSTSTRRVGWRSVAAVVLALAGLVTVALIVFGGASGSAQRERPEARSAAPTSRSAPPSSSAPASADGESSAAGTQAPATPHISPASGVIRADGRRAAKPVVLTADATPAAHVVARLASIKAVKTKASLPGEVGGPSLRVRVAIDNDTDSELSLTTAVVNLYFGKDRTPAVTIDSDGGDPFPSSVGPHAVAAGTFVFNVPENKRSAVRVEVDLGAAYTVVLFRGAAPR